MRGLDFDGCLQSMSLYRGLRIFKKETNFLRCDFILKISQEKFNFSAIFLKTCPLLNLCQVQSYFEWLFLIIISTECHEKWLGFDHVEMTIREALEKLNDLVDESDPDLDLPNIIHAFQTAERAREEFPEHDWLHLTGLIHDLGKIMAFYGEWWANTKLIRSRDWALISEEIYLVFFHTHRWTPMGSRWRYICRRMRVVEKYRLSKWQFRGQRGRNERNVQHKIRSLWAKHRLRQSHFVLGPRRIFVQSSQKSQNNSSATCTQHNSFSLFLSLAFE